MGGRMKVGRKTMKQANESTWGNGSAEVSIYGNKEHVIVGFRNADAEYSMYGRPSVLVDLFRWLAEKIVEIEGSDDGEDSAKAVVM